ncbi:hypothetical protein PGB90_000102 [Kerria lacca]
MFPLRGMKRRKIVSPSSVSGREGEETKVPLPLMNVCGARSPKGVHWVTRPV